MLRNFKSLYFKGLKLLRKDLRLLSDIKKSDLLPILNLHQISPHQNPFWSPMHPEIFDDLLVFLKKNFHVALFRELEFIKTDKPVVVLSFDDGYYNFVEYALPILDKHDLAVNMNIIPSCVESRLPPWNIQLSDFLNSVSPSLINEIRLEGFDVKLNNESFESKLRFGLKISAFLKKRPRSEREELWQVIKPYLEKTDYKKTRMMSAEDIKEIARRHEIGAHSFSHESMGFENNDFFVNDLKDCFEYFQNNLELPLEIYAFPNGSYRPEQIDILQTYGIKHTLLVDEKYSQIKKRAHPRFTIYGVSKLETRFQALGWNSRRSAF